MHPSWMIRPKTWASGRKSRVEAPWTEKSWGMPATMLLTSNMKLPWVSMQPLGRPVVPDV